MHHSRPLYPLDDSNRDKKYKNFRRLYNALEELSQKKIDTVLSFLKLPHFSSVKNARESNNVITINEFKGSHFTVGAHISSELYKESIRSRPVVAVYLLPELNLVRIETHVVHAPTNDGFGFANFDVPLEIATAEYIYDILLLILEQTRQTKVIERFEMIRYDELRRRRDET